MARLYRCLACSCLHGEVNKGTSYGYVKPYMTGGLSWDEIKAADERAVPYDITVIGSDGLTRRHGWFDPQTKLITQVG